MLLNDIIRIESRKFRRKFQEPRNTSIDHADICAFI